MATQMKFCDLYLRTCDIRMLYVGLVFEHSLKKTILTFLSRALAVGDRDRDHAKYRIKNVLNTKQCFHFQILNHEHISLNCQTRN